MCTTAERRSDRSRSGLCFLNRAVNQRPHLADFFYSPVKKALSTCQGTHCARTQQWDLDQSGKGFFSRLCVMSGAEPPPITAGVIITIIPQGLREWGRGGGHGEAGEGGREALVAALKEQAARVGTLVVVNRTACSWKVWGRCVWVEQGSWRRGSSSNYNNSRGRSSGSYHKQTGGVGQAGYITL